MEIVSCIIFKACNAGLLFKRPQALLSLPVRTFRADRAPERTHSSMDQHGAGGTLITLASGRHTAGRPGIVAVMASTC
jgi:hypothetical protein